MDYKPNDLFVGVIDFFAVLLPGARFSFALLDVARAHVFGSVLPQIGDGVPAWVAFVFASYMFGHFIFMAGTLLDKRVYDRYRKRYLIRDDDRLYHTAQTIKEMYVGDNADALIMNTFQWAKANVELRNPAAATQIHRLEADSKFFRSLFVVLIFLSVILLWRMSPAGVAVCLVFALLSFLRYAERRKKSTEIAYQYLIALERMPKRKADA